MLKNIQKKLGVTKENEDAKVILDLQKPVKKDKGKDMPSFRNSGAESGNIYQADVLYMPHDQGFKYALIVVDIADGVTDGEPIKAHSGTAVKSAFEKIFNRGILKFPKFQIQTDQGTELKNGIIEKYFHDKNVSMKFGKVDRHRNQALIESRNKTVAVALFQKQNIQELVTGEENADWIDDFPKVIEAINDHQVGERKKRDKKIEKQKAKLTSTRILFSPEQKRISATATKEDFIEMVKTDSNKKEDKKPIQNQTHIPENTKVYTIGTKVRVKLEAPHSLATGEKLHGTFRATDLRWSKEISVITNVMTPPDQPIMYQVDNDKNQLIIRITSFN